jgi:asparagine synthase (glutamine-hydrolysing)
MLNRTRVMSSTDSPGATADLAGVVTFAGAVEADRLLVTVTEAIGAGVEETAVDGPVVLGHRRGSVHRRDGLLCAFEGRLANHETLAGALGVALEAPPERIVAAAYNRWGQGAAERLRGEFVLAVWDATRGDGLLVCDPLGARTLFFHTTGGRLVFASDIGAVLRLLPTRPDIDDRAAVQWLALGSILGHRTLYAGVRRLEAGTCLKFDRLGCSQRSYWRPRYEAPLRIAPEEAAEEVHSRLRDTIAERLRGRKRAGILLSGGLDSSMVAAAAREAEPALDLVGYSMTFPDLPLVDESGLIQTVSEHLDITSVQMRVRGGSMLAGGIRFLEQWGLPAPAPNITFITALQSFAAREGVTLMLDGEGGDELFGADSFLLAHLLRRGRFQTAWSICRDLPGLGEDPTFAATSRAFWTLAVRDALPFPLQQLRRSMRSTQGLTPSWLTKSAAHALRADYDPLDWRRSHAPLWWSHLSHVLTTGRDQMGMSDGLRQIGALSSMERQHPLLDLELIEFVLRLPPEYAFRNRLDRAVQRAAMKSRIPDVIVRRAGKSFFTPLLRNSLLRGELSLARSLVDSPAAEVRRFVNQQALGAQLDAIGSPGEAASLPLYAWRLAMMECWLRSQADRGFSTGWLSEVALEPQGVDFATHAPAGAVRSGGPREPQIALS